jgi:hypothetical protein
MTEVMRYEVGCTPAHAAPEAMAELYLHGG